MSDAETFEVTRPDDPEPLKSFDTATDAENWAQDEVMRPGGPDELTIWKRGAEERSVVATVTREGPTTAKTSPAVD